MGTNVTLPTFEEREKLLHDKLNAAMQAIAAKFLSGVSTADLAWPLTAEGNLDMSIHYIVNGRKIWDVTNAVEYATLDDAIGDANSGGTVFIPPNTPITTSGEVDFSNIGAIIGAGASSVIRFTSGASTSLLLATAGTNMLIANVTLDGNSSAGTVIGVDLQGATETVFHNVWFKNFSAAAVSIESCTNVFFESCHFSGGLAEHLKSAKAGLLFMHNCTFDDAAGVAILVDSAGTSDTNVVLMDNVALSNCASNAVKVLGWNAPGSTSPVEVYAKDVVVSDSAGATAAVILGDATNSVSVVSWKGGKIDAATNAGMLVNASKGVIADVLVNSPGTAGIDLDVSQYVTVHDCTLIGDGVASTIGVDGSGCTATCVAHDNVITGFITDEVVTGANLVVRDNVGTDDMFLDHTNTSVSGASGSIIAVTIPAHLVRMGGRLVIDWGFQQVGAATGGTLDDVRLRLNSIDVHTVALSASAGSREFSLRTTLVYKTATTGWEMTIGGTGIALDTVSSASVASLDWTVNQTLEMYFTFTSATGPTIMSRVLCAKYEQGVLA